VDDLDLFTQRLSAFKEKKAEAERQEAQTLVSEIEAAAQGLSEQGARLLEKYRGALSEAEQAVQAIGDLQRQMFTLIHETQYLQLLYELPAHSLPKIELPQYEDLQALNATVPQVPRRANDYGEEWFHKLTRLKNQRERPQTESVPVQSRSPEPRLEPGRVTIPARPDHSGDENHQPNKMAELLRG